MTKTRFALFAVAAMALSVTLTLGLLLAGDLYLHHKYMDLVALNVWGYRGPTVGRKQPDEWRLAFLGGSTAFGYGVHWRDTIPALLEEQLNAREGSAAERRVRVLNLGGNGEGAHSLRPTLVDYDYLAYDAVALYSGYNDTELNTRVFRRDSAVFRLTGYLPLFPMIFQEKAMAIRWNGRLEDAGQGVKTTFVPSLPQRTAAAALETAVQISKSIDRQFAAAGARSEYGRVLDEGSAAGTECGPRFEHYCGEMYLAIRHALDRGKQVLIITQPYIHPSHREQQAVLRPFLQRRFGADARLEFADMGDMVDLQDRALCWDGMHLTRAGNQRIAAALEPHVRSLMD